MNNGYISLHRKILDHPVWQNPNVFRLFIYLLLQANHEPKRFLFNGKEVKVGRGQLITGRFALAEETGLNQRTIYDYLKILKNLEIINIKSNNKFSLITIVKYSDYQLIPGYYNNKTNNQPTTSQQPANTNNNDNNVNNYKGNLRVNTAPETLKAMLEFNPKYTKQ